MQQQQMNLKMMLARLEAMRQQTEAAARFNNQQYRPPGW